MYKLDMLGRAIAPFPLVGEIEGDRTTAFQELLISFSRRRNNLEQLKLSL